MASEGTLRWDEKGVSLVVSFVVRGEVVGGGRRIEGVGFRGGDGGHGGREVVRWGRVLAQDGARGEGWIH